MALQLLIFWIWSADPCLGFYGFSKRVYYAQWTERVLRHRYWLSVSVCSYYLAAALGCYLCFFSFCGYYWQHRWGFSTQSFFMVDRLS
jgi:hypothetical protein